MKYQPSSPFRHAMCTATALAVTFAPGMQRVRAQTTLACPETSTPAAVAGGTLETNTVRNGVVYDAASGGSLKITPGTASFQNASFIGTENLSFLAAGDFDKDGWVDFVGGAYSGVLRVYRNTTFSIPEPVWTNPTATRAPSFTPYVTTLAGTVSDDNRQNLIAADFNGDGWVDVFRARAGSDGGSATGTSGNWGHNSMESKIWLNNKTPLLGIAGFTGPTTAIATASDVGYQSDGGTSTQAVDMNGDGKLDLLISNSNDGGEINVFLNQCTTGSPDPFPADGVTFCSNAPTFVKRTTGGWITGSTGTGKLIEDLGFPASTANGIGNQPMFTYTDFNGDGFRDLVVGAPTCCATTSQRVRFYAGVTGNKVATTFTGLIPKGASGNPGGAVTAMFAADFSRDGKVDLMVASDSKFNVNGANTKNDGYAVYYVNTYTTAGTAPFPGTPFELTGGAAGNLGPATSNDIAADYDGGLLLDYDHNPSSTPDLVIGDGNGTTTSYYTLSNRYLPATVAGCGTVNSGTLPVPTGELVVAGGRVSPTVSVPSGTGMTFRLSNDAGATWVVAGQVRNNTGSVQYSYNLGTSWVTTTDPDCASPNPSPVLGETTRAYCGTFGTTTNQAAIWQAILDSNITDGVSSNGTSGCTSGTTSPSISGVTAAFDYTEATDHYRAGALVHDGITYTGSFQQPGDRGHLYAVAAGFDNSGANFTYWDAADKLDTMADSIRSIYTSGYGTASAATSALPPGVVGNATPASVHRHVFSNTNEAAIASIVGLTTTNTEMLVNWTRCGSYVGGSPAVCTGRFGVTGSLSRLGAIETSTPSVLGAPGLPNWYVYGTATDRAAFDLFTGTGTSGMANRIPLALFGSKDGMIHAVFSDADSATINDTSNNGKEAWAFVPPHVAANMNVNRTSGVNSSYPDGSPTLVDYKSTPARASASCIKTMMLVNSGNGGTHTTALDVTSTVTGSIGTPTVVGPTPKWTVTPEATGISGFAAGKGWAKPAVARTRINNVETYVAIIGSGIGASAANGKVVSAYELQTGAKLWNFQLACALTSDIIVFETNDLGEPGVPTIDGFIDRAVFADTCGNLYKVNPAQKVCGSTEASCWMDNTGFGNTQVAIVGTQKSFALFRTAASTALNAQSPIAGTIAARTDATTDMVLYFGTGGLESWPVTNPNNFYAIYAKDGSIRTTILGSCTPNRTSPTRCEKFYGGVLATATQFMLTKSYDAQIGGTTCDLGSATLLGYTLDETDPADTAFSVAIASGVTSTLYGNGGAVYFATLSGNLQRVGTPGVASAGGGSGNTAGMGVGDGGAGTQGSDSPLALLGWRQVF